MQCPCESGKTFKKCCEPFITGAKEAETAEQLMRSRYTAYTQVEMDYIQKTHDPKTCDQTDMEANREMGRVDQVDRFGNSWRPSKVALTMRLARWRSKPSLRPTRAFKNTRN